MYSHSFILCTKSWSLGQPSWTSLTWMKAQTMGSWEWILRIHTFLKTRLRPFSLQEIGLRYNETPTNLGQSTLTHWGRVMHICVSKLTIIGSNNGLSPDRYQAIIWTSVGILFIGPLGTNFNEIFIKIHTFSLNKIHLKMSPGKRQPYCLGLNVLRSI